ncbi:MAG TPA: hypothetical protein VMV14_06250 [Acidimicrobiales bacterium]|nr:hypothetical protein [Acidimicrobiales bacterium]
MTIRPTDYRTMRWQAASRDRAYADAYRAGHADGKRDRRRLVVVGVVLGALVVLRHRLHPGVLVLVTVALAVSLWPIVAVALAVETIVRQHRRWGTWPRTSALMATWADVGGLVYLTATMGNPWPLVAVPVALVAWAAEHTWRVHRPMRSPRRPPVHQDPALYDLVPGRTACALPAPRRALPGHLHQQGAVAVEVTDELPMLALTLTRKRRPMTMGSLSGWFTLDGRMARPVARSSRTTSGSTYSRTAANSTRG